MTRYNTFGIVNLQIPPTQQGLISYDYSKSLAHFIRFIVHNANTIAIYSAIVVIISSLMSNTVLEVHLTICQFINVYLNILVNYKNKIR